MAWELIESNLWRLRDSCDVWAVRGPRGLVLVNAGTGNNVARALPEIAQPDEAVTVLLTHYFRDHVDGAIALHETGATILANWGDREYYTDSGRIFAARETYVSYENRWETFAPVRPIPVDGWLRDYETRSVAGLTWEVIPTPGQSVGASSYLVTMADGHRWAFVGELISAPGKTGRMAPLQYNYNDLSGAVNVYHSCGRLMQAAPDALFPSKGDGLIHEPQTALALLRTNLRTLKRIAPDFTANLTDLTAPDYDDLTEVIPGRLFINRNEANVHFLVSDSGKVLALDYGYDSPALREPSRPHSAARRALLHGMVGLQKRGYTRVDTVLVTHHHDDHIAGIPLLQRLFNSEVWAGENFADILERPERYDRPCLWYEPIPVVRKLPLGIPFEWEGIRFILHPMSGHTRFSTLVCFEVDGVRVVHTGDQIFFDPWEWQSGAKLFTNHVYKNGLDVGCYRETLAHLRAFRPDWILTGHTNAYQPGDDWYEAIEQGAQAFDDVHRALMPLENTDVHFGAESQPAKLAPYHAHLPEPTGEPFVFDGWVLNPYPKPQTAVLRLVCPGDWYSEPITVALDPRQQKVFVLTVTIPSQTRCRRVPVALDVTVGGQAFGQVTEALVTVGYPLF